MIAEKLESRFYRIEDALIGLFYNTKTHRWVLSNLEGGLTELTRNEGEVVIKFLDWLSGENVEGVEDTEDEEEAAETGWINITDSVAYKVEKGKFKLGHKSQRGYSTLYALDYELVKAVYDELPARATSDIVLDTARKLGLKISPKFITYLMHFFSRYVDFDAELKTESDSERGRQRLVLVKQDDYSLREMNMKLLQQEKEVIGTSPEE